MRRQREIEEQQALIVKPSLAEKANANYGALNGDTDEYCLSTEEQLEARDYVQTLGNSQNSPRPTN